MPAATKRKPKPAASQRRGADHSLTDQAYSKLEESIVTLQFSPGEIVSEAALSRQLRIGRTPIREALHRLARERLVNILPRRAIVVSEINIGAQLRLLEVRREIERLVARSAARRASDVERTDRAFNELCLVAAHNEYAASAMVLMNSLSRRFWFIHYQQAADMPLAAKLHAAVARLIAKGDAKGAATASDKLLDYIEAFTRSTVEAV